MKRSTKELKMMRNTMDSIFRTLTLLVIYMMATLGKVFFGAKPQKKR
ncbi:hypothetical protein [Bacillus sp. TL12]|nr:hypothetical protein [Bacillus sp. TL12]MCI0764081.1 hypothetical protein [Bacillus sp. TL12]